MFIQSLKSGKQTEIWYAVYLCLTEANDSTRDIHHRMPLALPREIVRPWMEDFGAARSYLYRAPPL